MSRYNQEFENQIVTYRRRQRLLVAKNINFHASRADFESACRDKLSQPATARFIWRTPDQPSQQHLGWVMLGFEVRTDCRRAEQELQNFRFRGRQHAPVGYGPVTVPAAPTAAPPGQAAPTAPVQALSPAKAAPLALPAPSAPAIPSVPALPSTATESCELPLRLASDMAAATSTAAATVGSADEVPATAETTTAAAVETPAVVNTTVAASVHTPAARRGRSRRTKQFYQNFMAPHHEASDESDYVQSGED